MKLWLLKKSPKCYSYWENAARSFSAHNLNGKCPLPRYSTKGVKEVGKHLKGIDIIRVSPGSGEAAGNGRSISWGGINREKMLRKMASEFEGEAEKGRRSGEKIVCAMEKKVRPLWGMPRRRGKSNRG